mmetsp:Transcript_26067/g.85680  ORF Transcript_26067/g.85680 Transcript_26067/m.85680 type:complete len:311 (-) Transcript_26067:121-1053(-)
MRTIAVREEIVSLELHLRTELFERRALGRKVRGRGAVKGVEAAVGVDGGDELVQVFELPLSGAVLKIGPHREEHVAAFAGGQEPVSARKRLLYEELHALVDVVLLKPLVRHDRRVHALGVPAKPVGAAVVARAEHKTPRLGSGAARSGRLPPPLERVVLPPTREVSVVDAPHESYFLREGLRDERRLRRGMPKRVNLPRYSGADVEGFVEEAVPERGLVHHIHKVSRSLVVHAPSAVDKLQLAARNKLLHGRLPSRRLLAPPPLEKGNLRVREAPILILLQLIDHRVQYALHARILNLRLCANVVLVHRL